MPISIWMPVIAGNATAQPTVPDHASICGNVRRILGTAEDYRRLYSESVPARPQATPKPVIVPKKK